jgi:hypothetical protein
MLANFTLILKKRNLRVHHAINTLHLNETFRADIRAQSLQNVSWHWRAVPETSRPHFPECAGKVDAAVVSRLFRTFGLAERHPALAHAVMAPLICWSFSNSMFRYLFVDHAVPAMWRSLAAARLSAD